MSNKVIEPISAHDKPKVTKDVVVRDLITYDGLGPDVQAQLDQLGAGTPEPDFYMPLSNELNIVTGDSQGTFGRLTTGTYIDRFGALQVAAIDEPRFEREGLLMERYSTNMFIYSADYTNSAWSKEGGTTVTPSGVVTFIDGQQSMKVTYDINGGAFRSVRKINVPLEEGKLYTASIFAKAGDASRFNINIQGLASAQFDLTAKTATMYNEAVHCSIKEIIGSDGWFRCSVAYTPATAIGAQIKIVDFSGSIAVGTTGSMYFSGAQLEQNHLTSYIPTTDATTTRNSDTLTIDMRMPQTCTMSIKVNPFGAALGANRTAIDTDAPSYSGLYRLYTRTTYHQIYAFGDGTSTGQGSVALDAEACLTFVRDQIAGMRNGYVDGEFKQGGSGYDMESKPTKIYLGQNGAGHDSIYGHIRDFRMWFDILTDEQIRSID